MQADNSFIIPWCFTSDDCTATVFYKSKQVLRFRLQNESKALEVEKHLLIKSRQPWKVLECNFEFTGENDGRSLSWLFKHLDRLIKESKYDSANEYLQS